MEERKPLSWGRIGIVAGVALAVLFCLPKWQVKQAKVDQGSLLLDDEYQLAKLEDEYRRTLAQILGGLGLLYGLSLAERRIVATEENVRVALKNVRVAEEGHITERFTRAIAQLGDHENMAIRLGGIYALERLAKDSEKDHGPVMEVLTAHVREQAPRPKQDTQEVAGPPPTDIQAILTVIGRRETTDDNRRNNPLDLSYTRLGRANLREANLFGANLFGANLRLANLREANLRLANLREANLRLANLDRANLRLANLSEAALSEADLNGTNLSGANLSEAKLSRAWLTGADLSGADLSEADLFGANLFRANLSGADLGGANLSGVRLGRANLSGADLSGADLSGADLSGANLSGTNLSDAKNLTAEQVKLAEN